MNSKLYDNEYKLPNNVLQHIKSSLVHYPKGDGVRRAKFMLKNGQVTYQVLKRLKNFFQTFPENGDRSQYELAGGDLMKAFVDQTLNQERGGAERSRKNREDMEVDVRQGVKPDQNTRLDLNENDSTIDSDNIKKNALAVIINNDKQLLLLKRSPNEEYWGAGQWALVGGGIEDGETPVAACQREIWEETKLGIDKFSESFSIQRNPDSMEIIFIAKYDGDPHDITLNEEHTNYGWFSPGEIKFLDHVPNLIEYVKLAFDKYD